MRLRIAFTVTDTMIHGGLDKSPLIQLTEVDLSAVSIEHIRKINGKALDQFSSSTEESVCSLEEMRIPSAAGRQAVPGRRACESGRGFHKCRASVGRRSARLLQSSPLAWVSYPD